MMYVFKKQRGRRTGQRTAFRTQRRGQSPPTPLHPNKVLANPLRVYDQNCVCQMTLKWLSFSSTKVWTTRSGWCRSVDWAPACKPKGHWFDSQSGYMPGLRTRSPVGGAPRGNHTLMFLFLSFSLPFPLSKNKYIKSLKNDYSLSK